MGRAPYDLGSRSLRLGRHVGVGLVRLVGLPPPPVREVIFGRLDDAWTGLPVQPPMPKIVERPV